MPRNLLFQTVVVSAAVGMLVLIIGAAWAFHDRTVTNKKICATQVENRKALRRVLIISRDFSLSSPVRPAGERAVIAGFYDSVLATIPQLQCANGRPIPMRQEATK